MRPVAALLRNRGTQVLRDHRGNGRRPHVPPGAKLELLYHPEPPRIQGGLTEGVAAAPDGTMYFSEIPFGEDKGMIMRFDPSTKTTSIFAQDSHKSNGLMFDAKGFLIACEGSDGGGRGLARWDVKTGKRQVIAGLVSRASDSTPATTFVSTRKGGSISPTRARYLGAPSLAELEVLRRLPTRHRWDHRRGHA